MSRRPVGKDMVSNPYEAQDHRGVCGLLCEELHMATNLAIGLELLDRALEVSGERTKKAAVTKALQEFIGRRQQQHVADLFGKSEWDDASDHKAERSRS